MADIINRDLVRWPTLRWSLLILLLLVGQAALVFYGSIPVRARAIYPRSPDFAFAAPSLALPHPPTESENPFLFAGANLNGFSGAAWMRKPVLPVPQTGTLPQPRYVNYEQWRALQPSNSSGSEPLRTIARIAPEPTQMPLPRPERTSTLSLAGAVQNRELRRVLPLPTQYHSTVLSSSVVEVGVSAEGQVVAARLLASSGLKKADQDALNLARQALFSPAPDLSGEITWGKLIFHWHALEFNNTNAVVRPNGS